ncbi:MAG: hypothetical protein JST87_03170 [Bacteroidetes bacterium]|nr:hypothetical protein [Bacteroidota bacterium]
MKKIIILFVSSIFFRAVSSCNLRREMMSQLWFYTSSNGKDTLKDTLLTPISFLNLYPDGTYTRDFDYFESGKWRMTKDQLILSPQSHPTETLFFRIEGKDRLQLLSANHSSIYVFQSEPDGYGSDSDDPFSLNNNLWRIPPTHKESNDEIKKRLINHCHFWEMYFSWAIKYGIEYLDVRNTPTPIKIYGNGFALKPFDYLPERWRSFFYDDDDCKKANLMIKQIFHNGGINWTHADERYKMFMLAFQQMQEKLGK